MAAGDNIKDWPVGGLAYAVGHDEDGKRVRAAVGSGSIVGLRQVGTACSMPTTRNTTNKQLMSRAAAKIHGAHDFLIIELPNWFVASGDKIEYSTGNASLVAELEYPADTFTPIRFDLGRGYASLPGIGSVFGRADVSVPDGATVWIRTFASFDLGITYAEYQNTTASEVMAYSTGGNVADKTSGGTITHSGGAVIYRPIGIYGESTAKAFLLIGDSIMAGTGDTDDATFDRGIAARSVGPSFGYSTMGRPGSSAVQFIASHKRQISNAAAFTDIVSNFGNNDIGNGRTAAQIEADLIAIWSLSAFTGKRVWQVNFGPRTTSSDSWATTANQTVVSGFGAGSVQQEVNDWLADGAPIVAGSAVAVGTVGALRAGDVGHPLEGVIDIKTVVQNTATDGKWKVDGTANKYTADGIHPSYFAYLAVAASAAFTACLAA